MSENLWDKGVPLDPRVRAFTVGDDWRVDRELLPWDILGSAAHARCLEAAGALDAGEAGALLAELRRMREDMLAGSWTVSEEDEDGHTAIERRLSERSGSLGRKIHLGRSRNDQVALALRLLLRDALLRLIDRLAEFARSQLEFAERFGDTPLPGHTHLQAAMPSSWALWSHAWVEAALESMRALRFQLGEVNRSPLGAAAGFGSPVPLDRALTARLLGFSGPQRSVVDCIHARARLEERFLHETSVVAGVVEKLASDVWLYLTREFGYLRLDPSFQTGSSIMPQKANPDVAELLRARCARLRARAHEHEAIACKLPSNYHRDLQLLKSPLLLGIREAMELLEMAALLGRHLSPVEERLRAAMTADLDAARRASERALAGLPFRDAYRETALAKGDEGASAGVPAHVQAAARAGLREAAAELETLSDWAAQVRLRLDQTLERLFALGE